MAIGIDPAPSFPSANFDLNHLKGTHNKMTMQWAGVMPAITTCFTEDLAVDHAFVARHATRLIDNGCTGIVALGSLGEVATLPFDEKANFSTTTSNHPKYPAPSYAGSSV